MKIIHEAIQAYRKEHKELPDWLSDLIHEAIQAYRKEHKELPDWLSDLIPEHLEDRSVFVCPVTRRTGARNVFGLEDPKITTSYLYEFCAKNVPGGIWGGSPMTMKQWKQLTMAIVGSRVPILRCHQHEPRLNMGFNGEPFESDLNWEWDNEVAQYIDRDALSPSSLARHFGIRGGDEPPAVPPPNRVRPRSESPLVGKQAPNFELDLLGGGGKVELASFRGNKIVLLDFWATWCGPCLSAMPVLMKVAEDYADKDVLYLAVDLREDPSKVSQFLKARLWDLQVPLDRDGKVARKYGVSGIPTMVIVDKEGFVRTFHVGYNPNMEADLRKELDALVGG